MPIRSVVTKRLRALRDVAIKIVRAAPQEKPSILQLESTDSNPIVAGAVGFAGEIAKFNTNITTLESPIAALLATHDGHGRSCETY